MISLYETPPDFKNEFRYIDRNAGPDPLDQRLLGCERCMVSWTFFNVFDSLKCPSCGDGEIESRKLYYCVPYERYPNQRRKPTVELLK